jgi:hypothetical protein
MMFGGRPLNTIKLFLAKHVFLIEVHEIFLKQNWVGLVNKGDFVQYLRYKFLLMKIEKQGFQT